MPTGAWPVCVGREEMPRGSLGHVGSAVQRADRVVDQSLSRRSLGRLSEASSRHDRGETWAMWRAKEVREGV